MVTYFVVQSFSQGRRGAVVADMPIQVASADQATRKARKLAETHVAAVAFSRSGDPLTGEYDDAVLLGEYGSLPDECQQMALAS